MGVQLILIKKKNKSKTCLNEQWPVTQNHWTAVQVWFNRHLQNLNILQGWFYFLEHVQIDKNKNDKESKPKSKIINFMSFEYFQITDNYFSRNKKINIFATTAHLISHYYTKFQNFLELKNRFNYLSNENVTSKTCIVNRFPWLVLIPLINFSFNFKTTCKTTLAAVGIA